MSGERKTELNVPDTLQGGAQINGTKQMNERCHHPEGQSLKPETTIGQEQRRPLVLRQAVPAVSLLSLQKIFSDKPLASKYILLAEDNRISQQVVQSFLIRAGASVDCANNGIEALHLLKLKTFDAILMDVQMPEMDGLETTRIIRRKQQFAGLPIIGLSAGISTQERAVCIACGMNDFVPKPIHPEQLVHTLRLWTQATAVDDSLTRVVQPTSLLDDLAIYQNEQASSFDTPVGLDMANVVSMLGDFDLSPDLIKNFLQDTQHQVRDIQVALISKDFAAAQKIIHMLIGSAGLLGASALHAAAEQLSKELKRSTLLPETFQALQYALDATRLAVVQFTQLAMQHTRLPQNNNDKKIPANRMAGKTILVADDNRFVQQAMQSLLSKAGAHVLLASNGSQALELVSLHDLDAVLMDIQMPEMDGLQATRHIRAQLQHQHLVIIGLSATALDKEKAICIESGMNDLIAKTVRSEQLIEFVHAHMDIQ
jgi:CheY-like chemotaxis protein